MGLLSLSLNQIDFVPSFDLAPNLCAHTTESSKRGQSPIVDQICWSSILETSGLGGKIYSEC